MLILLWLQDILSKDHGFYQQGKLNTLISKDLLFKVQFSLNQFSLVRTLTINQLNNFKYLHLEISSFLILVIGAVNTFRIISKKFIFWIMHILLEQHEKSICFSLTICSATLTTHQGTLLKPVNIIYKDSKNAQHESALHPLDLDNEELRFILI